MKDQVDALRRKGISAAVLDSTVKTQGHWRIMNSLLDGTLDILYCAPKRLNNERFVSAIARVKGGVRLLAVDEAHCISEWGHSFRPDYLKVARFAKEVQAGNVVCLTATATPIVAKEICEAIDVNDTGLFRTSTFRSNLKLRAMSFKTKEQAYPVLRSFLRKYSGSTIVYVTTRGQTSKLAERLRNDKFNAEAFHAGMRSDDKAKGQEDFMASNDRIIVSTIAFGMGIDKADIRTVIHYDLPRSLEGCSQEIGRAGRDGLDSMCVLFLCGEDIQLRETMIHGEMPSQTSVLGLLLKIFSLEVARGPQRTIEAISDSLCREFDITSTTLGNIYARLELRFGIWRATTPKYTKSRWKQSRYTKRAETQAAVAIRSSAKTVDGWTELDMDVAERDSGVPRAEILETLHEWHDDRLIDLKPSGVVNVFLVGKDWPPTVTKTNILAGELYKDLEKREQQGLTRMQQVINLVTGSVCFAQALTAHFGDVVPTHDQTCGHCTWCVANMAVIRRAAPDVPFDPEAFLKVLGYVKARDDPRFLARIAFGIMSPRVKAENLERSKVFGSMRNHNYQACILLFSPRIGS